VLGLLRIDDTRTYLPPIWLSTFAYSFSAPTALITPDFELAAEPLLAQPARSSETPKNVPTAVARLKTCLDEPTAFDGWIGAVISED
jgi:hypothetical protein